MRRSASTKEALHRSLARPPTRPTVDGGWDDNDARRREARERLAEHRLLRPERDAREPRDVVHRCHLSLRRLAGVRAVVRAIGAASSSSKRVVEALRRIASIQRTNRYGQGAHITKWYRSDIAGHATKTPTARSDTGTSHRTVRASVIIRRRGPQGSPSVPRQDRTTRGSPPDHAVLGAAPAPPRSPSEEPGVDVV